ncbi:MAG: tetratricopeptide repeat protein, partial [Dehalococcoidia bacterium]|nr:tetratricopeptide repeat protein [Dehalococcoidia bacterium]
MNDDDVIQSAVREPKLQQLPTFADLLTLYMERTGIGDAELARRIPVSRPTLIRWREGVTTRPRYREDVARCAELLRLTPVELDEFLMAAGFSPESAPDSEETSAVATLAEETTPQPLVSTEIVHPPPEPQEATEKPPPPLFRRRWGLRILLALAAFLVAVAIAGIVFFWVVDRTDYPAALSGESLIVLAPFVNYTAGQQGFNVPGRLKEEIDREVLAAGIHGVRTVEWPKKIHEETDAEAAGRRADAMLVIWGEYDSGRVIARFTVPDSRSEQHDQQVVDIASTPSELPATINIGLTEEVRYVALLTLGQLHLDQGEYDLAKASLIRALTKPPADPSALANLRFNLGLAYRGGKKTDYDIAISLFSQVLSTEPDSVEAYNSRALTYLDRGERGDVELALTDLHRALDLEPDRAATYLNLAVAYIERGGRADLDRAIAELDKALDINTDYASAYVNRSAAYIARGEPGDLDRAFDDINKAIEIRPELASAHVGLGNVYLNRSMPGDLELALVEFSRAIDLDPAYARAYFNRGLVHSALENLGS